MAVSHTMENSKLKDFTRNNKKALSIALLASCALVSIHNTVRAEDVASWSALKTVLESATSPETASLTSDLTADSSIIPNGSKTIDLLK